MSSYGYYCLLIPCHIDRLPSSTIHRAATDLGLSPDRTFTNRLSNQGQITRNQYPTSPITIRDLNLTAFIISCCVSASANSSSPIFSEALNLNRVIIYMTFHVSREGASAPSAHSSSLEHGMLQRDLHIPRCHELLAL